jgi:hypothetical protein
MRLRGREDKYGDVFSSSSFVLDLEAQRRRNSMTTTKDEWEIRHP